MCEYYKKYLFAQSNLKCLKNVCFIDLAHCDGRNLECEKCKARNAEKKARQYA